MKKMYWPLTLALLFGAAVQAQLSFKNFYGAPSNADFGADVYRTPQGDYFITGTAANGDNGFDFFLLETDSTGAATGFEWYGGPGNDVAQRYVPLSDGGHLLLGYKESNDNSGRDGYALRLDASGAALWWRPTDGSYDEQIIDGVQLPDGSFVVAANVYTPLGGNDIRLERWSANGVAILGVLLIESGTGNFCRRLLLASDGVLLAGIKDGKGFIAKFQSNNLAQVWFKNDYTTAGATPQPLLRVEDLISGAGNNRFVAVGRATGPNVNTVFTIDEHGNTVSKFNTLLSGAVATRLARGSGGDLFIGGGDNLEHRDSAGIFFNENNGFDAPFDIPESIQGILALPSGGVALVGNTRVYQQGRDAMFSLLDTALTVQTSELYWNLGPNDSENGYSARQTADGGYILCGEKYHPDTEADVWLIKTDASGNQVWEITTGSSGIDVVRTLDLSGNDAFVVTGFSYDVQPGEPAVLFVRKFDLSGNELWAKFFPLSAPNFSTYSLIRTLANGDYLIALSAPLISATRRPTLLRLDPLGNVIWSKAYEDFNTNNFLRNLIETPEGNLLGVGASAGGRLHATLFDGVGLQLWSYAYGGQNGIGYGIAVTPDQHFVISGTTDASVNDSDSLYVAKIDPLGAVVWEQYFEGASYAWPRAHVNEAGEIVLTHSVFVPDPSGAGTTEYQEIQKLNANGTSVWIREISGLNNLLFFESQLTQDGGLMLFGYADNANSRDYCLIKTDAEGIVNTRTLWNHAASLEVFPSPARYELNIRWEDPYTGPVALHIFDATGRRVGKNFQLKNSRKFEGQIEVAHLPTGTYFLQLVTSDGIVSRPFIKG